MLKEHSYAIDGLLLKATQARNEPDTSFNAALANDWLKEMEQFSARVRQDWTLALYSDSGEISLQRYFAFQLTSLVTVTEELYASRAQAEAEGAVVQGKMLTHGLHLLYELVVFQQSHFPRYFDAGQMTPGGFVLWRFPDIHSRYADINNRLKASTVAVELQTVLTDYFKQASIHLLSRPTYRSLVYSMKILNGTEEALGISESQSTLPNLIQYLTRLNFNHLGFFAFLANYHHMQSGSLVAERLSYCRQQTILLKGTKHQDIYDEMLPSISELLVEWFKEKITEHQLALKEIKALKTVHQKNKIHLNLPVTYVACLLKLFYEAGIYNSVTLTDLFKFTAVHYQAKRQANMSHKSLAKEYYSIDQMTAARVKDLLLQFVAYLNRHYFPVWVGTCTIIHFY